MMPTAEQLDALFRAGTMKRLGMGSRRACYAVPGADFCVKCYRSDDEISEGKYPGCADFAPLAPAVINEIKKFRFDERHNTCCKEYRYWQKLKRTLPSDVTVVFPEMIGCVLVPSRGWCIEEELVANHDGSNVMKFHEVLSEATAVEKRRLIEAFDGLIDELMRHAVRFYDPHNVLVEKGAGADFRLRITDFEPVSRTFLSLDNLSAFFVRKKIKRRVARYKKIFGIDRLSSHLSSGKR